MLKKAQTLVPDLDITIIPNSVDTGHFRPLPKNKVLAEVLIRGDLPVIGFAGELREKKGISQLLDAYTQLGNQLPAVVLILGDTRPGEDKKRFDEYQKAHLDSRITVSGFISPKDLPQYYALMDVLLMPSLRDGLPNALLEGMACEKAIIATPVGGIADVIKDGENGRLVPVRDSGALATAIQELLADKPLRVGFGKAGRVTVVDNFSGQRELESNLALYQRLLG